MDNCILCPALTSINSNWSGIDIYKRVDKLVDSKDYAMIREELMHECMTLPYWDRVNLVAAIQGTISKEMLQQERTKAIDRGEHLLKMMESIIGEPIKANRECRYVNARTMVAYQLCREGFTTKEIGRLLHKDHSSISHMKDRFIEILAYPKTHEDIIDKWTTFQKLIQNETHKGTN